MARRERTTGLPRPRPRSNGRQNRRIAGLELSDRNVRYLILGGALAMLVFLVGLGGYRWYDRNVVQPRAAVVTVDGDKYSLSYFADRLYEFVQSNQSSGSSVALLEQALLQKLEEEALTLKLAGQKGITISEQDITNQIGADLGVPVGGSGSSFDTLYRQKLKTTKMSDDNYRRMTKAKIANDRLLADYEKEVGSTGETLTIRAVMSGTKDAADAIVTRIKAGEDMGTIAQQESTDLASRQKDGLLEQTPQSLLPEQALTAMKDTKDGDLVGPIQIDAQTFWVFRIEKRDPQGSYTTAQTTQLAQKKLDEAVANLRLSTKIVRDWDSSKATWAENHAQ